MGLAQLEIREILKNISAAGTKMGQLEQLWSQPWHFWASRGKLCQGHTALGSQGLCLTARPLFWH